MASNIKFPLLTMSSMQFQARAYKSIVNNNKVARARVIGEDPYGLKAARANMVAKHMSYQLLEEMPDWEEELDALLLALPVVGNVFRKTYFNGFQIVSELVLPQDVIVSYYAKSVESAQRKTHVIELNKNDIISYMRTGYFLPVDIDVDSRAEQPDHSALDALHEGQGLNEPAEDEDAPYTVYECHCWIGS